MSALYCSLFMDYGHPDEENAVDIIVTAPSSPEAPTNGITPEYDDSSELTKFLALDSLPVPTSGSMSAQPASVASSRTPFEDALAHASLPQPGPAYFAARREIWTTPRGARPTQPSQPSKRSRKFQAMLQSEGPIEDVYWRAGLDKIWKGLINGQKVREPLALRDLVRLFRPLDPARCLSHTASDQDTTGGVDSRRHLAKGPACPRTRR